MVKHHMYYTREYNNLYPIGITMHMPYTYFLDNNAIVKYTFYIN